MAMPGSANRRITIFDDKGLANRSLVYRASEGIGDAEWRVPGLGWLVFGDENGAPFLKRPGGEEGLEITRRMLFEAMGPHGWRTVKEFGEPSEAGARPVGERAGSEALEGLAALADSGW